MNPVRRAIIEAEIALACLRVERRAVIRVGAAFTAGFCLGAACGAVLVFLLA